MIRRLTPLRPSLGTRIPPELRIAVLNRDGGCVARKFAATMCVGALEIDHVRASHAIGMKSRTTSDNLVALCAGHHREKTLNGREWRPILISYLEAIAR